MAKHCKGSYFFLILFTFYCLVAKASVARQDMQTGHLRFCNAGHNPPIIGGGDSQGDFLEMQPNAPIGLFPGIEYEGEEIAA